MQYGIEEYKNTTYKEYIGDIQELVKEEFKALFGEVLI